MLVERFTENYINIVVISSGNKPSSLGNCEDGSQHNATIDKIISKYSSHPSVQKIKKEFSIDKEFELSYASAKDMSRIINSQIYIRQKVQMESLLSSLKFWLILLRCCKYNK